MSEKYRIAGVYREDVSLNTGIHARIRLVQPAGKDKIVEGFSRLSPESRYRQFLGQKTELSPEELQFITQVGDPNHMALGAIEIADNGLEKELIGLAWFVRLPEPADIAEWAIAVVDDRQRMGIGKTLLSRLLAAAAERDIKGMRAYMLASNEPMRKLIKQCRDEVEFTHAGPVSIADFPIRATAADDRAEATAAGQELFDLLRLVAEGAIAMPLKFGLSTFKNTLDWYSRSDKKPEP